ncbi:hypothetical protein TSUD_208180 [Trifolium subterraneum]|uniref:Reverse transcriptase zinc-binding domain-containing protein n=1 Tax=Trifolium subterraneum TaxID=3900 RepID=A0A2Z6MU67_TRISU|nr:hypothetical protein TSUD_208180 [Trifolium subterraneum]
MVDSDLVVHASTNFPFLMHNLDIKVRPFIAAFVNRMQRSTTAVELLGSFLAKLKEMVETQMKRNIRNVVLTVPVSLTNGKSRIKALTRSAIGGEDLLGHMMHLGYGLKICKAVTQEEFEKVNKEVFEKCERLIYQCLQDAKVEVENIKDAVIYQRMPGSQQSDIPDIEARITKLADGKIGLFDDESLIRAYAKRILETPLVSSVREDKVVWEEERNGCYSVKYGYKLAMRYMIGSGKHHVAGNWNGIWKAQAPHKARHLLWRLCRGCLPTRGRLLERRVECNLNCPVCDVETEDELHIFFRCAVARHSWCAAGLSSVLHNDAYQQSNAMDRIFAVCSNESSDTVGRVAMLLWSIWHNRNDKFWNDNIQMPRHK